MRYLIIGLGIYGENLARDLTAMGHEVIGADRNQSNIDAVKDYISTVYLIDSTEPSQLEVLPLRNVDLVIVAIGENFGASIKTVALLKKAGVSHIYARAIDTLHEAILESFEIDRIITPEQRAAADLSRELELGNAVISMKVDSENIILSVAVPEYLLGLSYKELSRKLKEDYSITLIAATRPNERKNILGVTNKEPKVIDLSSSPDPIVEQNDKLTIYGSLKAIYKLR